VKRLVIAALLATAIHMLFFSVKMPWTRPALFMAERRSVSIDLKTVFTRKKKPAVPKPSVETPRPMRQTEPEPKPPPVPKPKPKPRPAPKSAPEPQIQPPVEPLPEPPPAMPQAEAIAPGNEKVTDSNEMEVQNHTVEAIASESIAAVPDGFSGEGEQESSAIQASIPLYDINPPPVYPRVARRRNYQGAVVLDVLVTENGSVADIKIAQSSGHAILDRSAVKAVNGWRFKPATRGGRALETWVQVPVRFELQ
jgi:protein TonB